MKNPLIILFAVALLATIAWFAALGNGRTKIVENGNNSGSTATIYVLITASMAFLGETLLGKLAPVLRFKRQARLYKNWIKVERLKVIKAQQNIIDVEKQGFAWEISEAQLHAGHAIASDHARAGQHPCSK